MAKTTDCETIYLCPDVVQSWSLHEDKTLHFCISFSRESSCIKNVPETTNFLYNFGLKRTLR